MIARQGIVVSESRAAEQPAVASARALVMLFALGLLVRAALALPQTQPGYMDAAYYFDIAANLARGRGLSEDFVWNYLAHPSSLPQPSNAYWMPTTSFVVAPFLWLFGIHYRAAQLPMIILSALLLPLTYGLSRRLFARRDWALTAMLLMLASSFYLPFWSAIDSFALYALIGTGALWLSATNCQLPTANFKSQIPTSKFQLSTIYLPISSFLIGVLIGLAHLTRADGFLLFVPALWAWRRAPHKGATVAALLLGYLLVMLPWFARNVQAFGATLVGGSAVFMRTYDDLFSFEKDLTLAYWLDAGWASIIAVKARALVLNSATLAGALHFVFFPFALIGLWRERRRLLAQCAALYLLTLVGVMSLVLSLPGPRGTFLHSLTALLPLLYAFTPVGLAATVQRTARRRASWNAAQAERFFSSAFIALAIILSAYFYLGNVFGLGGELAWNERFTAYQKVEAFLRAETNDTISPVVCINPPAYYYFNQRAAIMLPTDDALALVHAASEFAARYVVVEADHPRYLDALYDFSAPDLRFQLRATFSDAAGAQVQLYQIVPRR